ncbi:MAG: GNAT family N-acetyltransferase [Erysipelotrichaceae bacterium]|nr:GNAT family N-acetyltransferase [Erysipelotrichaceae bacterium]
MTDYYDGEAVLTTDRLILRPLKAEDASAIFKNIYHDKEAQRYYLAPYLEKEEDLDLNSLIRRCEETEKYAFAIVVKGANEVIGMINQFGDISKDDQSIELGYAIGSRYWNQGYATEALREMIRFLFSKGIRKVCCRAITKNVPSIKVMQKSGMKYEGRVCSELFYHGRYWDVDHFYITEEMFHVKQKIEAVLFDFNGTLFFDSDINRIAWKDTLEELSGGKLDFATFYMQCVGTRNQPLVEKAFEELGIPVDEEQVMYWAKRKETRYYQEYCRKYERNQLAPGAIDFISYLKEKGIPYTMCTASLIENVEFYFSHLGLDKWFDINKVIYDDGIHINKKEMYLDGAAILEKPIRSCLVIDDSLQSIQGAIDAGCRQIIAIRNESTPDLPEIIQTVDDFSEIDLSVFD